MTLTSGVKALAEAVAADVKEINLKSGDLSQLTTTANSNLVEAINEVAASGVDIDDSAGIGDTDVTWSADKSAKELVDKVNKEAGKQLSDENYTLVEKNKLSGITEQATKNRSDSENADKVHTHTISDVTGLDSTLAGKVDKVAGKGLSDTNFTQAEKDKLSSLESSKFVGLFVNESALPSSGSDGDYANVDGGAGSDVYRVIWDTSDTKWVRVKGVSTELTDAQIKQKYESNPDTNAFTDDEKTKLDGVASGATKNRLDSENADKVHTHSPAEVGLGEVDNTSDEDKPMSRAQRAAMAAKFNRGDVTQEVGDNSSKVMSQKASTETFYRAGSGVTKAGKIHVQSTEPTVDVEDGDIWLKI